MGISRARNPKGCSVNRYDSGEKRSDKKGEKTLLSRKGRKFKVGHRDEGIGQSTNRRPEGFSALRKAKKDKGVGGENVFDLQGGEGSTHC